MVQVSVSEGILEGEKVKNDLGEFCSFKGIPYAAPPVGDLRFKASQPPKPWDGVRSAKEHGPICIQQDPLDSSKHIGSEDCLYLNVYTPRIKPASPLPVMVWIHGGAFILGSGDDCMYGPEFLVRHNVIVVTINYRLGVLGFLCLDTEDIPGNAGMKDQVAALRWVQKNINAFGGDSNNVTIFGESAGGGSVGFHLISPMSKGLFKRAIAQSGSSANWWANAFEPRERALVLAKQLGFYSEDDKKLYDFFINQPVKNLVGVKLPITKDHKPYENDFGIANEKKFGDNERFFNGDAIEALKNVEGVDVMTGYTKDEGLMTLGIESSLDKVLSEANSYKEFFVPKLLKLEITIKDQINIGKLFKKHYLKEEVMASTENFDDVLKFLNLDMFVHGVLVAAHLISNKNKTYLYKFNCFTERNFFGTHIGLKSVLKPGMVCHGDDLSYLFPIKMYGLPYEKNSETAKIVDRITTLWTNFAKFGNPTPDSPNSLGVRWKPFSQQQQDYLVIDKTLRPDTHPERDDMLLWNQTFKKYLPNWLK